MTEEERKELGRQIGWLVGIALGVGLALVVLAGCAYVTLWLIAKAVGIQA
jgi:tetrahydromethanopterin S-methyltransferase subunit G